MNEPLFPFSVAEVMLPAPRLLQFIEAFNAKNKAVFDSFVVDAAANLRKRGTRPGAKDNGQHFLDSSPDSFLNASANLIFVRHGPSLGPLVQPAHWDGGASIMHMGVGLWGKRVLTMWEDKANDIKRELHLEPGGVYFGPVTGPWHQA